MSSSRGTFFKTDCSAFSVAFPLRSTPGVTHIYSVKKPELDPLNFATILQYQLIQGGKVRHLCRSIYGHFAGLVQDGEIGNSAHLRSALGSHVRMHATLVKKLRQRFIGFKVVTATF